MEQQHQGDLIVQWPDGNGYLSLKNSSEEQKRGIDQIDFRPIYQAGRGSAVWGIGTDTICKVKVRTPNVSSEADNIAFVQDNFPSIPLPEVLYTYVHKDCTALFLRRVNGDTLAHAWGTLAEDQHYGLVNAVSEYCEVMAKLTSNRMMGVGGQCLLEPYLETRKDTPVAPLTVAEALTVFEKYTPPDMESPEIKEFHFYHPDLGPGNIMVRDGSIVAIIDWEAAGFYPYFWIATKPSVSPGLNFHIPIDGVEDHYWRKTLKERLISKGFPWVAPWWMEWNKRCSSDCN
ncbi:hypothetical protein FH972_024078 [Carpinus fangiana]|uniref:Aminoglycoside phosphotransferase domain-containing protein n=1 Tax=Carpinus fangiana TaxID=176857 RepID=A0A5N6KXC4_9ROSI|nr:hypothetical protein FH972_024078 [Carpinus fangiana]